MPETSRERETEAGRTEPSHNVVAVISQLADEHVSLVRNISTGLAIAGVVVLARSIRLTTKFQVASQIPARFIQRNVSLRGTVRSVTEAGLQVEHVPIHVPLLSPVLSKRKGGCASPLSVNLVGVEPTPEGWVWLRENLPPDQTVWLKLISREGETLHCLVSQSKGVTWSRCLNEEVLQLGLARTAPLAGVPPDSRLYWRLCRRLHRAEVEAERKGRGLWREDSPWERASKAVTDSALVRLLWRIFKRT